MSTTQHTGHYNLPTFGDNPNDRPSWRGDFTDAMTKIDNQMYANATNITTATAAANNAKTAADEAKETASGAQSALDSLETTTNASITALQSKDTQTDGAIAEINANLTALGVNSTSGATQSKVKWDKASSNATANKTALTALDADTSTKAADLKNTIDSHTTDIAGIKTDYATKQYVNSAFLKHANVAVAKVSNMQFTVTANTPTPKTIVFDEHDATTSFDDEDGVITLSTDRKSMHVSKDGVYLVSADMRVGAITFTDDDSYRGIELLVYVNNSIMATAPASMVVGANGAIRGAQYAAFPCRPYKLTSGDKVALKIRSNDTSKEISGTINYAVLSVFRISK